MAVNFSNLAGLRVVTDARPFTFFNVMLDGENRVVIHSRPALTNNVDYQNETLRRVAERKGARRQLDAAAMTQTRDEDREVFAHTCVTGWEYVVDADGNTPEFSPEACLEFFQALPDDIFDDFRAWVVNPENFRAGKARPAPDGGELGKSQPPG